MSGNWFKDLGWWDQKKAYGDYLEYRNNPTEENREKSIVSALSIIRVVYSSQKIKINKLSDEDDLISSAALTITKAIPKMIEKPLEKMDDDKKFTRYLFTCVINAFYREFDVLHGKSYRLQKKIDEESPPIKKITRSSIPQIEANMTLDKFPEYFLNRASKEIRFSNDKEKKICMYILRQKIYGRDTSKAILQMLGCKTTSFYTKYIDFIIKKVFSFMHGSYTSDEFYDEYITDFDEEEDDFSGFSFEGEYDETDFTEDESY